MTRTRRLTAILCMLFVMVMFCLPVKAEEGAKAVPDGYLDKNNRVTILDAESFIYFMNQVYNGNTYSGKYVSIRGDFDLEGHEFKNPGGFTSGVFSGTLDGCGHTIQNFTVSGTKGALFSHVYGGLIAELRDGIIKNLTIDQETYAGPASKSYVAALVGGMTGSSQISNCTLGADVSVSGYNVGGLVCEFASGTRSSITDCTSAATVTGNSSADKVGGILAYVADAGEDCLLENCKNYGSVTGGTSGTGGIVGYMNPVMIANCENHGNIGDGVTKYAGGIVGYQTAAGGTKAENAAILNSKNTGSVQATSAAGGIAGNVTGSNGGITIHDCTNAGAVQSNTIAGGIVGNMDGATVEDCRNTGTVTSAAKSGGVVGALGTKAPYTGIVKNCSGGTAAIKAPSAGRQLGSYKGTQGVSSGARIGNRTVVYLSLDDTNGDSYDGLPTVGQATYDSGIATLVVEAGTLHGQPNEGGNTGYLILGENATWDAAPDGSNGTLREYKREKGKAWVLNQTFNKVVTESESTCETAGVREYYGLLHTVNTITRTTEDTSTPVTPVTFSYTKDAVNGIAKCTLTVDNAKMGKLFNTTTFDNMRFTLNLPDGLNFNGCSEKPNSDILFTNMTMPNQGCYTKIAQDAKSITVTAHDLYRRDGSHTIYDGSNPAYPKTDLYDRATSQNWTTSSFNTTTITFDFYLKAEDVAQLDTLMEGVTAGFGFVDYTDANLNYMFNATTANPKPSRGKITTVTTTEDVYTESTDPVYTETMSILPHKYSLTNTEDSTCSSTGSEIFTCANCGKEKKRTLPASSEHPENTAHDGIDASYLQEDEGVYREPTTTAEGIGRWYCPECGCTDVYTIAKVIPTEEVTPKAAAYRVEYYKENLDGTYTLETAVSQILMDEIGKEVTAPEKTYENYTERMEPNEATGTVVMPTAGGDGEPVILVLKRYYELNAYTVSFDLNGGNGTVDDQTEKYGSTIQLPDAPTKPNCKFTGWKLGDAVYQPGDSFEVTADVELLAQWEAILDSQNPTEQKPTTVKPADSKPGAGANTGDRAESGLWLALLGTAGALAWTLTKMRKDRA